MRASSAAGFEGKFAIVRKLLLLVVVVGAVAAAALWWVTMPASLAASELPNHDPDRQNGAYIFVAAGCASCHAVPGAKGDENLVLAGGLVLSTPFGDFHVPNISPDPDHGIGAWTLAEFVASMKLGVGRDGRHLYPAFPYASYQRMRVEDIIDLKSYLDTLPPVATRTPPHALRFPFNIRRGVGLWQFLYVDGQTFAPDPAASAEVNRGAYLVRGPGHCGECHSPRNFIGGIVAERAYSGGPAPQGEGTIPNITPDPVTGIGTWSTSDIVNTLTTGFTPDFDSLGAEMVAVQRNMARLTADDRAAIAAFLKSLPPIRSAKR